VGDLIRVSFEWGCVASTGLGGSASITGGYNDTGYMALTINDLPPTGLDLSKAVWKYANVLLGANAFFSDSAGGDFMAQIDDIIGIHLGAGARVDFAGAVGFTKSNANNWMELEAIPGAVWLLSSGLIGLGICGRFRNS